MPQCYAGNSQCPAAVMTRISIQNRYHYGLATYDTTTFFLALARKISESQSTAPLNRFQNGVLKAPKFEIAIMKLHNANCCSFGQICEEILGNQKLRSVEYHFFFQKKRPKIGHFGLKTPGTISKRRFEGP